MKDFFKNIKPKWSQFKQHAKKEWRTFLFVPAHYWRGTLVVFGIILLIILLGDVWLFWRFARAPQHVSDEAISGRFRIKHEELESALRFLREREIKLLQKDEGAPLREIFSVPSTPTASTE